MSLALRWQNNPLPFLSTLYSRELYEAVEGYNGTWTVSPDFHFLLKVLRQDPLVIFLDEEFFAYRVHADNQTAKNSASPSAETSRRRTSSGRASKNCTPSAPRTFW